MGGVGLRGSLALKSKELKSFQKRMATTSQQFPSLRGPEERTHAWKEPWYYLGRVLGESKGRQSLREIFGDLQPVSSQ